MYKIKPTKLLPKVIGEIASAHGVSFAGVGTGFRLEMLGYDRLVVERIAAQQVSIAHYYEQNGDTIADPEIVFWDLGVQDVGWYAISYQQALMSIGGMQVGGYERILNFDEHGDLASYNPARHNAAISFANQWAHNLREQGWAHSATLTKVYS